MKHPLACTIIVAALAAGTLWQPAAAEELLRGPAGAGSLLVPFDFYPQHREELGMSEDQVRELHRIAEGMNDAAQKMEAERRGRTQALQEVIAQRPIDVEKAVERLQAVLKAENELKALQFRSGVAAQNLLTPEQAAKLPPLAMKERGARDGANPAAIREKLEQLRGELRKRNGGELSPDVVATLERAAQAAEQGKGAMEMAKQQVEGLLSRLGQKGGIPGKPTKEFAESPEPTAAEIDQQAVRVGKELEQTSDPEKRERLEQQLAKLRKMQERMRDSGKSDRPEKNVFKGGGEKEKGVFKEGGEGKVKGALKGDGEDKGKDAFKESADGKVKGAFKGDGEEKGKGAFKGRGEEKENGASKVSGEEKEKRKFDKTAEPAKRPDPELRKRIEGALAEFQEAKLSGNREALEKITHSIETMLRDNARADVAPKDGVPPKESVRKYAPVKE